MLPLNYAILKIFEDASRDLCVYDVMDALRGQYSKFKAFTESYVTEALMSGQFNGLLDETSFEFDENKNLRVYYRVNEEGKKVIGKYIKG